VHRDEWTDGFASKRHPAYSVTSARCVRRYHHTTVLAYCWYAFLFRFSPGWQFGTVNAFVHTIMYWYYFRRACGVKLTYDK